MKTEQEIRNAINSCENDAAELSFELNSLDQRAYEELGPEMGDKLSKLEGYIKALRWVIYD